VGALKQGAWCPLLGGMKQTRRFEVVKEIVIFVINIIALAWFAWEAFMQKERADAEKERADKLAELNDRILDNSDRVIRLNCDLREKLAEIEDSTEVTFVADESVKSDPECMEVVDGLMNAVGAKLDERTRVANRTLEALRRMVRKIESGESIAAKRVTIEQTPDGPLTTVDDVTL
jgi:hypothetical protein